MGAIEEPRSWLVRSVHLLWIALAVLAASLALTIAEHGSAGGAVIALAVWLATGFTALGTIGLSVVVPGWFRVLAGAQVVTTAAAALAWPVGAEYDHAGHAALPRLLGHPTLSTAGVRHWSTAAALLVVATLLLACAMWLGIRALSRRAGWEARKTGLPWLWYLAWSDSDVRRLRGRAGGRSARPSW